jgi:hypothetical protein
MTINTDRWGAGSAALLATGRRWARSPNVVDRPTLRGVMVLPPEGAAVVLTGVTSHVWQALARPVATDELVGRLSRAVTPEGPSPDEVAAALGQLQAMGAVREIV